MTCWPYSIHILHPLGWYMMERVSFHIHAWLSGSFSSTSIGECSRCPPLLGEPLGLSSSLGWPVESPSSPVFGGFLLILLWSLFFWLTWLVVVVAVENSLAYFSILLHHHFSYCHVPDFLHFDYCFLSDITITLFGRSCQFLTSFSVK